MYKVTMELFHVVLAVLSLLSVGYSAPVTNCESLIQPLEIQGRDQLLGRWTYIAESTNIHASKLLTEMFVDSVSGEITAAKENDRMKNVLTQKMLGRCFSVTVSYTLENNTIFMAEPFTSSGILLNTGCPDCLVFSTKTTFGTSTYSGLQLLSRRTKVTAAELEEFKKQVKCLNLPSPAILDSEKGFCSHASQEIETIDLTNVMNSMNPDIFTMINNIISIESGLQKFIEMISSSIPGFS